MRGIMTRGRKGKRKGREEMKGVEARRRWRRRRQRALPSLKREARLQRGAREVARAPLEAGAKGRGDEEGEGGEESEGEVRGVEGEGS